MSRLGWSRPVRLGVVLGIAYLAWANAATAQPRPRSFASPEDAFNYLHQVARSPRCVNCHGMYRHDGQRIPTVGDAMSPHPMNITARHNPQPPPPGPGEKERPVPFRALQCTSCHGIENALDPGGPPGAFDRPLKWQMPTRSITRLRPDISKRELCINWRTAIRESLDDEARRNEPRRTATAFFVDHIGHDKLIEWAFDPGKGRTQAPGSFDVLKAAAAMWAPTLEDPGWCDTIQGERPR